ncbi:thioredoxin-related protein [Arcticibacter pallidicorallinus]|uniref:Thioredoxin-related protein n=2 Tax=Arcticibacter pallidicorallinus TaxID=1259464 RepID=A0A2T0U786_9SPHI|nr:thioredoxin-related protein [Arcticibacter pallidicorallinus]
MLRKAYIFVRLHLEYSIHMIKRIFQLFFILSVLISLVSAQDVKVYNPGANAAAEIRQAISKAGQEGKHVFLQIGGNWCVWCLRFNELVIKNDTLSNKLKTNYVVVHVNHSKENKNEEVLASLGYPQRFGFPVFVILDGKGNLIHTQNSAYLESGKGHSSAKVLEFLNNWSPLAIDPRSYISK